MKNKFLSVMAIALGLTFSSCGNSPAAADSTAVDTSAAKEPVEMPKEEGVMVGGALMVPSKNIVENAMGSTDHTTLVAAVKAGDLVATLSGEGPFTVFAPTNEAFAALPAGTVDKLLKPEMKKDLVNVLTYHVVPGSIKAADLKNGMTLKTVQGKDIKITEKNGVWMVNDAPITIADVVSSNGVTHVITGVLMPPAGK